MHCWCKTKGKYRCEKINNVVEEKIVDNICYCPICNKQIWFILNIKRDRISF